MTDTLDDILRAFQRGALDLDAAKGKLGAAGIAMPGIAALDDDVARVDIDRLRREGAPEVIFGENKTPVDVARIARALLERDQSVLVTRANATQFEAVRAVDDSARFEETARCIVIDRAPPPALGSCALLTAGTSDRPVAAELEVSARFFGVEVHRYFDVGVAGLHRVLSVLDDIRAHDVVCVVAGMDGALPSVVGGLVRAPVIAVPTSVGYGASLGGLSAMFSMLNACSAGITVVNVDNGFGAARATARVLSVKTRD